MQAVSTISYPVFELSEPVQEPRGNPFHQIWIIGNHGLPYVYHNYGKEQHTHEALVSGLLTAMASSMEDNFADTTVGFDIKGMQHVVMSKVYPEFIIAGMVDAVNIDTNYVEMLLAHIAQLFQMSYDENFSENMFNPTVDKFERFEQLLTNLFTVYSTPTDTPVLTLTPMSTVGTQPAPKSPPVFERTGRFRGFLAKIRQKILNITKKVTTNQQQTKEIPI